MTDILLMYVDDYAYSHKRMWLTTSGSEAIKSPIACLVFYLCIPVFSITFYLWCKTMINCIVWSDERTLPPPYTFTNLHIYMYCLSIQSIPLVIGTYITLASVSRVTGRRVLKKTFCVTYQRPTTKWLIISQILGSRTPTPKLLDGIT